MRELRDGRSQPLRPRVNANEPGVGDLGAEGGDAAQKGAAYVAEHGALFGHAGAERAKEADAEGQARQAPRGG
eukprot:713678-Pyramimonas_sp.AAC.1